MKSLASFFAIAILLHSPVTSAHDLGFLFCEAQLEVGKGSETQFMAPALVSRSYDSLNTAREYGDQLTLDFNTKSLKEGVSLILDGRTQSVDMNTHLKVQDLENELRFELRDTVSGKNVVETLGPRQSGSQVVLNTQAARMNLSCIFSVLLN